MSCLPSCTTIKAVGANIGDRTPSSFTIPTALSAEAIVSLSSSGIKGRANIFVKSPNLFRIEVLGPFDKLMALMVSDGESFSLFDGKEFALYDLSDEVNPLRFEVEEIVSFLIGSFNSENPTNGYDISYDSKGFVSSVAKTNEFNDSFSAQFSKYRDVDGSLVPFSISIDFNEDVLSVDYKTVSVSPQLAPNLFTHPNL